MTIIESFNQLFYSYQRQLNTSCKLEGFDEISISSFQYLIAIFDAKQITNTELSNRLGVKKASATQMVQQLITKGYIQKASNAIDKRSSFLQLTEKGEAMMVLEEQIYHHFIHRMQRFFSPEECHQFEQLLAKAAKAVSIHDVE